MTTHMEAAGDTLCVFLEGELDHHSSRGLREQIDRGVERMNPRRLRLDFAGVSFMDSSGIGLVMGRFRLIKLMGGTLRVTGASERIGRMMRLAGLDRLDIWEESDMSSNEDVYSKKGGKHA